MARKLAIFDFDNTLVEGDSLWPFLNAVAGRTACYMTLARAVGHLALRRLTGQPIPDRRSFFKDFLLRALLAGRRRANLAAANARTAVWQKPLPLAVGALRAHKAAGATILIATGSLNLYMPDLLRDLPYDELLCTDIGEAGGVLTGCMEHGNCVRETKAERIAAWLATQEPFDEIWAYGNYPHDLPMMRLAQHRVIVS